MPIMDGHTATRRIRQMPAHATTPIVALTADHSMENNQKCSECGMTEFYTKPITPENWESILSLARQRARYQLRTGCPSVVLEGENYGGVGVVVSSSRDNNALQTSS
jgi:CheY-like chemotaxis protein